MATFTVTSTNDTAGDTSIGTAGSGGNYSGTLRQAINFANQNAGDTPSTTIVVGANVTGKITLAGNLPLVASSIDFDAGGLTLDGAATYRGFLISGISSSSGQDAAPTTVNISNLTIQNVRAKGGDGGDFGGGGLGAGGAAFVGPAADVTLTNVNLVNTSARGGNSVYNSQGYGGGGGLGGDGGNGDINSPSGGGGGGILFTGGVGGSNSGGGGGGISSPGGSGANAGGGRGGSGVNGLGGGGDGGTQAFAGGNAGFGGGGGGGANNPGGDGSFGGGGGAYGGDGGFGGGGGATSGGGLGGFGGGGGLKNLSSTGVPISAQGGFAAGSGGGGGALGGAIFVAAGGSLTIAGTTSQTGGSVAGGNNLVVLGQGGGSGSAYGAGIFYEGGTASAPATLTFGAGNQSFANAISDLNGAAGNTTTDNGLGGSGGVTAVAKTGSGTLTLGGVNTYTGGTTLAAGIISVGADTALGASSGGLTFKGGTLETVVGIASARATTIFGSGTIQVDGTAQTTLSGIIADGTVQTPETTVTIPGTLIKAGTGTLSLTSANSYTGGTRITNGTLVDGAAGGLGAGAVSFQAASGGVTNLLVSAAADPGNVNIFANTLDSFGLGDTLDLSALAYQAGATATVGEGVLTVASGGLTRRFNITNPNSGGYGTASDGNGGTLVGVVTTGLISYTPGATYDTAAVTNLPLIVYNDPNVSYTVKTGTAANGNETVTISNGAAQQVNDLGSALAALSLNFSSNRAAVSLTGGGGGDRIVGGAGNDTLTGGSGDDTISGRGGSNVIDGGVGNDTVSYATFAGTGGVTASLAAGTGSGVGFGDTLRNLENIRGSIYADTITGNSRANILDGFGGADTISGGAGNDRINITQTPTSVDGGDNFDVLTVKAGGAATLTNANFLNIERVVVENGSTLDMSGVSRGLLIRSASTAGNTARISGTSGNDRIYGGIGQEVLRGGAGNDTIYVGEANQMIEGGAGNDLIYASTGAGATNPQDTFNMMMSGFGRDTIRGTANALSNDIFQVAGLGASYNDLVFAKYGNGAIVTGTSSQPGDGAFFSGLTVDQAKGLNFQFDQPPSSP